LEYRWPTARDVCTTMKIAYLSDQQMPRTATDTAQSMAMVSALGAAGADVHLVLPVKWGAPSPDAEAMAVYYGVEPTFRVTGLRSVYPFIRGVEKLASGLIAPRSGPARAADVLYTRNLPIVTGGLLLARVPIVYETYRPWPRQRPLLQPLFRWMSRHDRFTGAVLHSRVAAEAYRQIGFDDDRLLVSHNGYNPGQLTERLSIDQARQRCGWPSDRTTVTYAGRVDPEKGLGSVLDLAALSPDVHFTIIGSRGDGPIERQAATLDNVSVIPWCQPEDLTPYLFASDILLVPPTSDPLERAGTTVLPIKTFLYMAVERPIFGPASEDLLEVLTDQQTACLVPPDDLEAAHIRLRELVEDAGLRARLASAARAAVAARTWEARAHDILGFLDRRLSGRPR